MAELRQLRIKTGSVKRLRKELDYYADEVLQEQKKVDQLRAEDSQAPSLQQAENVLAESKAMIPDTRQRLEAAAADLKKFLAQECDALQGEEDLDTAKTILQDAEAALA